jgi:hypothetical protein
MQFSAFSAFCPFEIGDKVRDISGNVLEITDIASVHYLKKQTVEFMYEFNNSGQYKTIEFIQEVRNPGQYVDIEIKADSTE